MIRGNTFRIPDAPVVPGIFAPPPKWPDTRAERLHQLWERGWTAGCIAVALGVSRNAVIGKAHRMVLSRRASPIGRR